MMIFIVLLVVGLPGLLGAPADKQVSPWTVYKNGKIYSVDTTIDWSKTPQNSLAIQDGVIKCIGTNEAVDGCVAAIGGETVVVDLKDQFTILPGFHDVHQHPLEASNDIGGLCRLPGDKLPNSPETKSALDQCKTKTPTATKWFLGTGHSISSILEYLADPANPDPKTILDGLFKDSNNNEVPALMMEATSHSVWVNSAALKEAGITKDTPNPTGGIILKNSKGEPNGILLENAGNMALDLAFDIEKYPQLGQHAEDAVRAALKTLAQNGITSVVEARSFWRRKDDLAWDKINANGEMTVRAILAMWAYPELDDKQQIAELKARYQNPKSGLLRKNNIKLYSDGLLGANTAALLQPYLNDIYNGLIPNNRGIHYFDQKRLTDYIRELQNIDGIGEGYDFMVHAIGDEAVRQGLDSVKATNQGGFQPRHRLTHVELIDPADIPRFKELNVIADPQLSGSWTLHDSPNHKELETNIGKIRADRSIPVKDLLSAGAKITLSSDWDVNPLNPFIGLQHALQRGTQAIDLKSAVEMYTINSAFAMRQETITGSLVAGKEADLIIVDKDIFNIPIEEISTTVVQQTLLKGKEVFKNPTFNP